MQGKLQETLGRKIEHLDSMRHALERLTSLDVDRGAASHPVGENTNPELEVRAQKVSEKFSENIQIIANEPSLAFYRIQEHVRKTLPLLLDRKHEVLNLQKNIQGSCFDTEYAINALKEMESSRPHFASIQELIKNSMFMKQQIQYEQERRQIERSRPSMYRPMMRTQTLDISTATPPGARDRRAEFTRSVQLPTTTSLSHIEEPPRARSSSLSVVDKSTESSQQQEEEHEQQQQQ